MSKQAAKPETFEVTFTAKAVVDPGWIEFVMGGKEGFVDLFSHDYCGFFLQKVKTKKGYGFLARINFEEDRAELSEAELKALVKDWLADPTIALPEGYFTLNTDVAVRAFKAGCERWGVNCYDEGDADTYDYMVQMALFGECVYG